MSEIALRNVCKQFDSEHYGVKDFNLDIHDKEFVIFVGPSGCGKSTTLRIIAGLEEITDGELWIDGELSNYLEPKERGMSMVFQNYALYPNMTVYGNMAYALKIRKVPKDEIDRKVHEVAKILEIEQLLDRKPAALSGGQKQRVAIGSAIIRKPKAFLMDEPLSNLDAKLRAQMRVELVKLHKQLDTTIIYVTHDQTEAMTLGTKIVVMKDGLIQQVGAPQNIYDDPINLFVAGFLGSPSMNFFQCTVKEEENNRTALILDDAKTVKKVYLDGARGKQVAKKYNGRHVILGIRPEDIYELDEAKKLGIEKDSVDVDEPVVNREMLGAEVILYFDEQGKTLAVRLSPENQTQVGEKVSLYFDMDKAHVFDPETEENIKATKIELLLYEGTDEYVAEWMEDAYERGIGRPLSADFFVSEVYQMYILAKVYVAFKRNVEAAVIIHQLRAYAVRYQRTYYQIKLSLLEAILLESTGEDGTGKLKEAVLMAAEYGYIRVIADEGEAIFAIWKHTDWKAWMKKTVIPEGMKDYFTVLEKALKSMAEYYPDYLKKGNQEQRLSKCEDQVMNYIYHGKKNEEIAQEGRRSNNILDNSRPLTVRPFAGKPASK